MIIFYEPTTKQIKALYTHDTTATWPGLTRLEVTDEAQIAQIHAGGQDLKVVVSEGVLTDLEGWARPVLTASLNPMPADGVATSAITATFADGVYAEDVTFQVDQGAPMVVAASGGVAVLVFGPCEVAGRFEVRCTSPLYGVRWIDLEVTDA